MTEIHSFDSFPITLLVRADIVRLNMQILIATAIERDDAHVSTPLHPSLNSG